MNKVLSKNNKLFLFCISILSMLVFIGNYKAAGFLLTIFLVSSLLYVGLKKTSAVLVVSWLIGFTPFIILLRQYIISYSGFTLLLLVITIIFIALTPDLLKRTYLSKTLLSVFIFIFVFICIGLLQGVKYIYFLKYLELILGLMLISLVFFYEELKVNALKNMIISTILIWIVLMKDIGNRFSLETSDGFSIGGDPSGLAIFIIFSMIIVFFDHGRQINLEKYIKLRTIIFSILIILLLISTSRTNMGIFMTLILIYSLKNLRGFIKYLFVGIPIFFIIYSFLDIEYTNQINKFFIDKLFSDERNINQVTTGRFDQWVISFHYIFNEDLLQVLFGYGPGQRDFLYKYSLEYQDEINLYSPGKAFVLHSFYLNVMIEYGLIAFIIFFLFLLKILFGNIRLFLLNYEIPLYFTITYLVTILGNSGLSISASIMMAFILSPYFIKIPKIKKGYK